jgi:putative addiction module CopG family antidote
MSVTLTPELEKYIDDQVKAGRYGSPEELLSAAILQLKQSEQVGAFAPGELDGLLAEGEADIGRGDTVDAEQVREHFRRRAAGAAGAPKG